MSNVIKKKFDPRFDFMSKGQTGIQEGTTATGTYDKSLHLISYWKFNATPQGEIPDKITPDVVSNFNIEYAAAGQAPTLSTSEPGSSWIQDYSNTFDGSVNYGVVSISSPNDPFSFCDGDGSTNNYDKPFSVSIWFQPFLVIGSGTTNSEVLIRKGGSSTSDIEWSLQWSDDSTTDGKADIYFVIYSTPSSDSTDQYYKRTTSTPIDFSVNPYAWYNVTVTYDGDKSDPNMNIYVNGTTPIQTGPTLGGSYTGMKKNYGNVGIGATATGVAKITGQLGPVMIWNCELSARDADALYQAQYGAYKIVSGYLNNPARVIVAERDNMTGSYPGTLRTTGFKLPTAKGIDPFNDTRSIRFKPYRKVVYPYLASVADKSKFVTNWVATPGQANGISAPATCSVGITDSNLIPSVNTFLQIEPFDESRVYIDESLSFYATGTNPTILPGFSSRLSSKTQIVIPIEVKNNQTITRYNSNKMLGAAGNPAFEQKDVSLSNHSGFVYYNFNLNKWDHIGLTYPVTGDDLDYTMWTQIQKEQFWGPRNIRGASVTAGGTWNPDMPMMGTKGMPKYQFKGSDHTARVIGSYDNLLKQGYQYIGTPTVSGLGPNDPTYYATSSNRIKMSDYISEPFVLQKAVIKIPVHVQMAFGHNDKDMDPNWSVLAHGAGRDIDNYTFFLYRQQRKNNLKRSSKNAANVDTLADAVNSSRYLIMSGCAAFWNENVFNSDVRSSITDLGLPHNPSFEHKFTIEVSGTNEGRLISGPPPTGQYTGSLIIEMTPAVPNGQFLGATRWPVRSGSSVVGSQQLNVNDCTSISDFWPGGTGGIEATGSIRAFTKRAMVLHPGQTDTQSESSQTVHGAYWGQLGQNNGSISYVLPFAPALNPLSEGTPGGGAGTQSDPNTTRYAGGQISHDDRPLHNKQGDRFEAVYKTFLTDFEGTDLHSLGGQATALAVGTGPNSTESPYLLLPEDELVLGMDAGITFPGISGSFDLDRIAGIEGQNLKDYYGYNTDQRASYNTAASVNSGAPASYGTIPTDSLSMVSGSSIQFRKGRASITLFGSSVKESVELGPTLNQNLTSDAVHEAVGCERITDQFMFASKDVVSGSYIDRLILGSFWPPAYNVGNRDRMGSSASLGRLYLTPRGAYGTFSKQEGNVNIGPRVTQPQNKHVSGSRLQDFFNQSYDHSSGPEFAAALGLPYGPTYGFGGGPTFPAYVGGASQYGGAIFMQDRYGYTFGNSNLKARNSPASLLRGVRLFDETERWYDTLMPDIIDYLRRAGVSPTVTLPNGPIYIEDFGNNTLLTEKDGNRLPWPYAGDDNRKESQNIYIVCNVTHASFGSNPWPLTNPDTGNNIQFQVTEDAKYRFNSLLDPLAVNTLLFRKGYRFDIKYFLRDLNTAAPVTSNYLAASGSGPSLLHANSLFSGSVAQSFAYGLMNVAPMHSSCVFRHDRYGQFRDMLEQRGDGKFYKSSSPPREAEGIIGCKFVNQGDGKTIVAASLTDSVNLSSECTASMPFNEGFAPPPPPIQYVNLKGTLIKEDTLKRD
jgi:hypothetical protein